MPSLLITSEYLKGNPGTLGEFHLRPVFALTRTLQRIRKLDEAGIAREWLNQPPAPPALRTRSLRRTPEFSREIVDGWAQTHGDDHGNFLCGEEEPFSTNSTVNESSLEHVFNGKSLIGRKRVDKANQPGEIVEVAKSAIRIAAGTDLVATVEFHQVDVPDSVGPQPLRFLSSAISQAIVALSVRLSSFAIAANSSWESSGIRAIRCGLCLSFDDGRPGFFFSVMVTPERSVFHLSISRIPRELHTVYCRLPIHG